MLLRDVRRRSGLSQRSLAKLGPSFLVSLLAGVVVTLASPPPRAGKSRRLSAARIRSNRREDEEP